MTRGWQQDRTATLFLRVWGHGEGLVSSEAFADAAEGVHGGSGAGAADRGGAAEGVAGHDDGSVEGAAVVGGRRLVGAAEDAALGAAADRVGVAVGAAALLPGRPAPLPPLVDGGADGVVGRQGHVVELHVGHRADRLVTEPLDDRRALVGVAVGGHDGVLEDLAGDRAQEDRRGTPEGPGGRQSQRPHAAPRCSRRRGAVAPVCPAAVAVWSAAPSDARGDRLGDAGGPGPPAPGCERPRAMGHRRDNGDRGRGGESERGSTDAM